MRDGAIGTEQACCCVGVECPACPDEFYNCRVRIFSDFGDFQIEWTNDTLAEQLQINRVLAIPCAFNVIVLDLPSENCTDSAFSGVVVIGFDEACQCPVIKQLIGFSAEDQIARALAKWIENGDDPEDFPGCDPFPFSAEINGCGEPCGNPLP